MVNSQHISAALESFDHILSARHKEELDRHYQENRDILIQVTDLGFELNDTVGITNAARRIVEYANDSAEYAYHFTGYHNLDDTEEELAKAYIGLKAIDAVWTDSQDLTEDKQLDYPNQGLVDAYTTVFQLLGEVPQDVKLDELSSFDIAIISIVISSSSSVYVDDPSIQLSLASFLYVLLKDIKRERERERE
jgi:hypothetical protein